MAITGLSHVGLSTPDLDRAIAFYCDALGFAEVVRFSWEAGNPAADAGLGLADTAADIAVLHAGNTYFEILQFKSPVPHRFDGPPTLMREGISHVGFTVSDPAAFVASVVEHGGSRVDRSSDAAMPSRLVRDPDGNLLELQPPGALDAANPPRIITTPTVADATATATSPPQARRDVVHHLHHVGVCTLDADRQATFYLAGGLADVDDVTWTLTNDDGANVRRRMRTLTFGNAYLELNEYLDEEVAARPADARIIEYGFNHLCVDVDDIATAHPHLIEAGMKIHAPWTPMPGGNAAMGYGLDATGLPIELLEHRTARSTMWPGHLSLS